MTGIFKSCVNGLLGALGFRLVSLGTWKAQVPSDFSWIRKRNIRTFLDIGAHVGELSRFARREFPDARILAFEPLPECEPGLRALAEKLGRMEVIPVALGDRTADVPFHRSAHKPSSSLLAPTARLKEAFPEIAEVDTATVPLRRLDDMLKPGDLQPAVFMKIDVQGFEDRVLAGAERTLERTDVVLIEVSFERGYEGQCLFDDVYRSLKARRLDFHGAKSQLFDPRDGSPLQMHAFFVRSGEA